MGTNTARRQRSRSSMMPDGRRWRDRPHTAWLSKAGLMPNPVYLHDREHLRQSGLLKVVQPETAITMIRDYISKVPVTHYYAWTLPPGLPPRWAQAHLELFASKVIPAFR